MSTSTMQRAELGSVVTVKGRVSMRPPHQRNTVSATLVINFKNGAINRCLKYVKPALTGSIS